VACARNYRGARCGDCNIGSYRLMGKCRTCPNTAWLLLLSFFLAITAFVAVGVWLSKKNINLAGLSVGVVRFAHLCWTPIFKAQLLVCAHHSADTCLAFSIVSGLRHAVMFACALYPVRPPRDTPLCGPPARQDFLQVLSMFAGFGFDWPAPVKAIYNAFSLVNFNFELLAPECSVSINFETKWCVVWICHCRNFMGY
jgi:hypothetical protein